MSIQRVVPRCIRKALFGIASNCKQPTCPPTGERIRKLCHIRTVEHSSVTIRSELLMCAPAQMTQTNHAE